MKMTSSIIGGMVTTLKCYSNPEGSEMKRLFKLTTDLVKRIITHNININRINTLVASVDVYLKGVMRPGATHLASQSGQVIKWVDLIL